MKNCSSFFGACCQKIKQNLCLRVNICNNPAQSKKRFAFSLVEMLMALLVASLLMVAVAPVMTKKFNDSLVVSVEGMIPGKRTKTDVIDYNECLKRGGKAVTEKDDSGKIISEYCEGEFNVPLGFNGNIAVTAIGAGGGGAAAATAGYVEYTEAGSTNQFVVPLMTNKLEATLMSGGAGGGAGGQTLETWKKLGGGSTIWSVPNAAKNKIVNVEICGAGGGGGTSDGRGTTGGGGGAYLKNAILLSDDDSIAVVIGGHGGDADGRRYSLGGSSYGGGAGGSSNVYGGIGADTCGGGGGYGDWALGLGTTNDPSAGSGALDGGGDGTCDINVKPAIGSGVGGSSGAFSFLPRADLGSCCTAGAGGVQCGGGGAGGRIGSGGGGGAASTFGIRGQTFFMTASGGGGGAGLLSPGAGGGGSNGGNGGDACTDGETCAQFSGGNGGKCVGLNNCTPGNNGEGNWSGGVQIAGNDAKSVADTFPDNCGGGQDGAVKVSYLNFGPGGSGGGAAQLIPIQPVNAVPGENLRIKVGVGASGGKKGYIDSTGAVISPTVGSGSNGTLEEWEAFVSRLYRGSDVILTTSLYWKWSSAYGGNYTGEVGPGAFGCSGNIGMGLPLQEILVSVNGFSNASGRNAGDFDGKGTLITTAHTFSNGSTGGRGGTITTPFTGTCTPGSGGTVSSPKGKDATGFGCGGGGGYGLADGGAGSGGYARISWNKFWNVSKGTNGDYDLNDVGGGGGGAGGNIMKYTINVKSGEKLKYRVGKGGKGAYIVSTSSASIVEATKGGDTIFGYGTNKAVKAGGGLGGKSPSVSNPNDPANSVLLNGIGGEASTMCTAASATGSIRACTSSIKTFCCTKANGGAHPELANGGDGETLNSYGEGGRAKSAGRGDTNGNSATGYGSGGAGASLKDFDKLTHPSESVSNPTTGGNGSNGVIMLQWEE